MGKDALKELTKPREDVTGSDSLSVRRWGIIHSWKPSSEVFVLKYGAMFMSSLGAISGMSFYIRYRRFLKLGRTGFVVGALPSILVPSAITGMAQYQYVQEPLVNIQSAMCPTCFEIRSACIQVLGGVFAPILTTSSVTLFLATIDRSTAMPRWQDFSYWARFYKDMNKGIPKKAAYFSVFNMAAALVFVSLSVNSLAKVWDHEHGSGKVSRVKHRVQVRDEEPILRYPFLEESRKPASGDTSY